MAQNNCPSLQKSLSWCEGAPSHPGIRRRVYFCNKNLIVAYPTLQRDALGRPTSAVLQGNFELQADANWQFLDINIDKSTVKSDPQGERPSQTQLNKGTFLHNGVGPEATAAASWLNNSDNVYVYEDMLGRFRVLGNNKWATTSKVTQDQGQGTNPASTLIEVEVTDEVAAPFYNGTLETIDGEVSPETVATDENADNTPTVTTSRIYLDVGESRQIVFSPNDGNWTFQSANALVASVNSSGIVTGVATNTKPVGIRCSYSGTIVAIVDVLVEQGQGGDPGVDPDTPPAEEDVTPSVTPTAVTLLGGEVNDPVFNHNPANGWTFISDDEDVAKVGKNGSGQWYVTGENEGQTNIRAINGGTMITIPVKTIYPQDVGESYQLYLAPGQDVEFDMIPTSGWHGIMVDKVASVEVNGGHVKVTGEIDTGGNPVKLILFNDDGQRLDFDVNVDESNAG